jgi:von Willebrand factor type A domain
MRVCTIPWPSSMQSAAFCVVWLAAASQVVWADDRSGGQTQVFGVVGNGTRFVYVFDRSLSMKGTALAAAKQELLASIKHLDRVHQFQIVFYNEAPRMMQPQQMHFADENGLRAAESFVSSISASGGTDHVQALKLAMRLSPDVIFLLTDADEPQLSRKELEEIRQRNGGAAINVIEFKSGPDPGQGASLRKLAEENRGQYKYVDITRLPAGR